MQLKSKVLQAFKSRFNADPQYLTKSPGRVNLIGEHTDYNDGFVLPMAINYETMIALRPREDRRVIVHALDRGEILEFDLRDFSKGEGDWKEYITGVAWILGQGEDQLKGWEGVFSGNVPIGAGLSSSAALELAVSRAFALVSDLDWDPTRMALSCQKAENKWVGVNSGIMDQMISANGQENSALMIDCRSLETKQVPLPEGIRVVILDTTTRRGLVDSAYNERREQCEAVARHFDVQALREINLEQLEGEKDRLDNILYRRARHVVSGNQRVLKAVEAMENGDPVVLGQLMNESHISMRDDFEISRKEMDQMVAIAQEHPGCFGSRMTGGGFGGCAIALVAEDQVESFQNGVVQKYKEITGLDPQIYISCATNGTSFEDLSI